MSVNTQNNSRLKRIEELKAKINQNLGKCSNIMETLKQRGVDISGLANMGLSQDEIKMIAEYFTCKNEAINMGCDVALLKDEEYDDQARKQELNQLEADRKITSIKEQEEAYHQQKIQEENSYER